MTFGTKPPYFWNRRYFWSKALDKGKGIKGMGLPITNKRLFSNSNCHCEPFASCHSERSEESHGAQDRLREAISLLLSKIAELVPSKARKLRVCFVAIAPRNGFAPRNDK